MVKVVLLMTALISLQDIGYENFADSLLYIRDKQGRVVPFVLNNIQRKINNKIKRNKALGIQYNIILKYRRGGITTNEQAKNLYQCISGEGQHVVTIAHETEDTEKIFGIARLMYSRLYPGYRPRRSPKQKRELEFPDLESKFYIGTAGSKSFSRGSTLQRFHASEVAFWPGSIKDIDNIIASLTEAASEGIGVLESTANGVDNWFYEKWKAVEQGQSGWGCIFLPWFEDPTNFTPLGCNSEIEEIHDTLQQDEIEVIKIAQRDYDIHLTLEQIKWRRATKSRLRRLFNQEYPETPETAFLTTGVSFFDLQHVERLLKNCKSPRVTKWGGLLRIWEAPISGEEYVAGTDVASGINDERHDFTSTVIVKRRTGEHVATFKARMKPNDYTRKAINLLSTYNQAFWGIERNEYGHAIIADAITYEYPNLYKHESYEQTLSGKTKTAIHGWPTNKSTRGILIDDFDDALTDKTFKTNDEQLLGQCKVFVMKKGRFEASEGYFDDDIFAASIANQMRKYSKKLPEVHVF